MENDKIKTLLLSKGKFLPENIKDKAYSKLQIIEDESLILKIQTIRFKNPTTYTILYWLLPGFAFFDRILLRTTITGLLKVLPLVIFIIVICLNTTHVIQLDYIGDESTKPIGVIALNSIISIVFLWFIIDGFTVYRRVQNYNLSILANTNKKEGAPSKMEKKNNSPINSVLASKNLDFLERLHDLKEKGIITEQEFNNQKKEILQNPSIANTDNPIESEEIGGILILVMFGIIASCIYHIRNAYSLQTMNSEFYQSIRYILEIELIGSVLLTIYSVLLLYLLASKKKLFPRIMIIYLISNFVFVLTNIIMIYSNSDYNLMDLLNYNQEKRNDLITLATIFIVSVILIPYTKNSKRVKSTFTN